MTSESQPTPKKKSKLLAGFYDDLGSDLAEAAKGATSLAEAERPATPSAAAPQKFEDNRRTPGPKQETNPGEEGSTPAGGQGSTQTGGQGGKVAPQAGFTVAPMEGGKVAPTEGSTQIGGQGSRVAPTEGSTQTGGQGARVAPTEGSTSTANPAINRSLFAGQAQVLNALVALQDEGVRSFTWSLIAARANTTKKGAEKALASLAAKGFITKEPAYNHTGRSKIGLHITIHQEAHVAIYLSGQAGGQGSTFAGGQGARVAGGQGSTLEGWHPNGVAGGQGSTPSFKEEDKETKNSSSFFSTEEISRALQDPELSFWVEQGLETGHIQAIKKAYPHKLLENIIEGWRQARWHFEEEGFKPNGAPPLAYAYQAFLKTGSYARRPGYKSPLDLEIEEIEGRRAEQLAKEERLASLRRQEARAAAGPLDFDRIWQEKGGDYQALLDFIRATDSLGHKMLCQLDPESEKHKTTMASYVLAFETEGRQG